MARTKIELVKERVKLSGLDMSPSLKDHSEYKQNLDELQLRMLKIQQSYYHQKRRAIIVLEGVDAGGKGGIIRRLTEHLDPRGLKVWPIGVPSREDQGKHYLYRFWEKLPEAGTLAIFDRSWYGRVLVERVEGFCDKAAWKRAYHEINEFERMLHDDGIRIVKLLPMISKDEQLNRFAERIRNPYKRWKITGDDLRNRDRWDDYIKAMQQMLDSNSTTFAPWHVIAANKKWYARITAMRIVTETLEQGVNLETPPLDPELSRAALQALGLQAFE